MYASRSRCDSPCLSTLATSGVPSSSSARFTSPMQPPPRGRTESNRPPRCASIPPATILSATVRQVTGTDVIEETLGCLFDQTEDVGETIGTKVIRVGNLRPGRIGCEIQERSHHSGTLAEGRDRPVVLLVHRQDVIEPLAVFGFQKASPLARDVYPT